MDHEPSHTPVAVVEPDLVRVSVRVPESVQTTWRSLHDPTRLAMWFGDLDQPWCVGRAGRVDFGDGDFFSVTPTEIIDGNVLEFEWSFLGVGPTQRIRWTVRPRPDGAEVFVEDRDPLRSAAEADQMVEGWTDFFERLADYLTDGRRSRYSWRGDIDGSVDLPESSFAPLRPDTVYWWLPIASDAFRPRWFFIVDDEGPRRFEMHDWELLPNRQLTFRVAIPQATASTSGTVVLDRTEPGTRLRFSHSGWGRLGLPAGHGWSLRRRFARTWVATLEQARNLAAAGAGV